MFVQLEKPLPNYFRLDVGVWSSAYQLKGRGPSFYKRGIFEVCAQVKSREPILRW